MLSRVSNTLVLCVTFVTFSGCGNENELPSEIVSGMVTLNGEPFTGAAVHFYNPSLGGGAFNLTETGVFTSPVPIPVAEYMVSFDRPGPNQGETPSDIEWPEDKSGEIPKKYRSSGTSGFVARVFADGDNSFLFEMTGKPSGKGAAKGPAAFTPLSGFDE